MQREVKIFGFEPVGWNSELWGGESRGLRYEAWFFAGALTNVRATETGSHLKVNLRTLKKNGRSNRSRRPSSVVWGKPKPLASFLNRRKQKSDQDRDDAGVNYK